MADDIQKDIKALVNAVTEQNKLVSKMIGAAGPGDAKAGLKPAQERLKVKKQETEQLEKQLEILEKQKHSTMAIVEKEEIKLELAERALAKKKEELTAHAQSVKRQEEALEQRRAAADASQEEIDNIDEQLDLLAEKSEEIDKQIIATQEQIAQNKQLQKEADELIKRLEQGTALAQKLGEAFRLPNQRVSGLVDKTIKLGSQLKQAFADGSMSASHFAEMAGASIMKVMVDNVANLVLALYDAENAFRQATGASAAFAREMTNVYDETRTVGATIEQASAAYQALHGTATDFTLMTGRQREELGKTGAMLQQYGIDAGTFAEGVQVSTKLLGLSATEAGSAAREFNALAQDIGVPPQQLSQSYAQAGGTLAKFGKDGVKAFKDLSMISKLTGMDMNKILNIVEKFDTFEGAADQAGKLNAALGGNFVNAMDLMMETDPVARFEQIRGAISQAGLTFDDMSYYQKNFYKDALGLSDVGELALMLSGDMSTLENQVGKTSAEYEKQAAEAKNLASLQRQWNMLVQELVPVLTPAIDLLRDLVKILHKNATLVKVLVGLFVAYKSVIMAMNLGYAVQNGWQKLSVLWTNREAIATGKLSKAKKLLNLMTSKTSLKIMGLTAAIFALGYVLYTKPWASNFIQGIVKFGIAFEALGDALDNLLQPLTKNWKGLLALGGAMLMVGTGIGIAAAGVAELARAFGDAGENAWAAVAGIAILGATLVGLGYLITAFAASTGGVGILAVLAFGAAFLMLGAGIALAALGFKTFVSVAKELTLDTIMNLSLGIAALGASLHVFASPALSLAAAQMLSLSLGLAALTAAMALFGKSEMGMEMMMTALKAMQMIVEAVTAPLRILESVFATLADPAKLVAIGEAIGMIAEEVGNIPATKTIQMTALLGAATTAANTVATVGGAQVMAQGVVEGITGAGGIGGAGGAGGVGGAGGAGGAGAATPPVALEVQLNLDGKKLDKKVITIINDKVVKPGWSGGIGG